MLNSLVKSFKLSILALVIITTASTLGYGQNVLVTSSGQKLLISEDGSWTIMKQDESLDEKGNVIIDSSTSLDVFNAPTQGKYPLTIEEANTVSTLLKTLQSDEAQLLVNTDFFKKNISKLELEKREAKKSKDKELTISIQDKIKSTEKALKTNETAYRASSKLILNAKDLLAGKVKKKTKLIAQIQQSSDPKAITTSGMGGTIEEKEITNDAQNEEIEKGVEEVTTTDSQYPTSFSVDITEYPRSENDCEIVFDGYDEALGLDKKEVKAGPFFGYSQEKMKPYFKSDDFIKCDASVSKVGKRYFLTLSLRVQSKDAKKSYGMLSSNENIRIELIDGTKVYCENMIQDNGTVEAYTGHTLYTGIYRLDKEDFKKLKNKYLDNIGVMWSSGFEQYNIFDVDFLRNQIKCLEN